MIYMLGGKARSGKDTTASFIKAYYERQNKKCIILQISEYLKFYAKKALNWDGSEDSKPRQFLQDVGTMIRSKDELFFINRIIEDINILFNFCDVIVISDVRFPIEFAKIKEKFDQVKCIHVIRNDFDNGLGIKASHMTEVALDDFNDYDYTLENNGSLEMLEKKVNLMLKEEVK